MTSVLSQNVFDLLDEDYKPKAAPLESSLKEQDLPKAKEVTKPRRDARRGGRGGGRGGKHGGFDRRSGAGFRSRQKRDGRGSYNYGANDGTEQPKENKNTTKDTNNTEVVEKKEETTANEAGEKKKKHNKHVEQPEIPEEDDEPETFGLDEWEKQQKEKAVAEDSNIKIRTANEGDASFKGASVQKFARSKDFSEDEVLFQTKEGNKKGKAKAAKKTKQQDMTAELFKPRSAYRGTRGRGRGRGERGGGRDHHQSQQRQQINITDEQAFPSLS